MAEESTEDICWLASNTKRHMYTRMLSWEFSQETKPSKPRRRHKSKKSLTSEEDPEGGLSLSDLDIVTSSDDSEYYSADEDGNQSETSSKDTLSESFATSEDSVFQSIDKEEVIPLDTSTNRQKNTRHRAPSKKQKRKRHKTYNCSEDLLPFHGTDDIMFSFTACYRDVQNQSDIVALRHVPSLVELCINKIHRNKSKTVSKTSVMPKPLKGLVVQQALKVKLQKIQMSWLLALLSHFNPKNHPNLLSIYYLLQEQTGEESKTQASFQFVELKTRNIFNSSISKGSTNDVQYIGTEFSSFLPCLSTLGDQMTKKYDVDDGKASSIMSMLSGINCFTTY